MSAAIWIILSVLVLTFVILLSPVSALIEYNGDGCSVTLRYLFVRMTIPRKTPKQEKPRKNDISPSKPKPKRKGTLRDLVELLKLVIKTLGKLVKSIRVRDLKIDALIASDDPFKTAILFGTSGAAVGVLLPLIEQNFRVDRRTVNVNADFEHNESSVDLFAKCSIRVIQVLAIALVFAYNFLKDKKSKEAQKRKDVANVRAKSK